VQVCVLRGRVSTLMKKQTCDYISRLFRCAWGQQTTAAHLPTTISVI
jgi:hypothetical protein